jgi:hypothetical protein
MKRLLLLSAWLLLGVVLGLPVGAYWINRELIRHEKAMAMLVEEGTVDYFAKAQYRYADRKSAREALLFAIQVHKQMESSSPLRSWAEKTDLGFCYGELSLLEEASGNADAARTYMVAAQQTLKDAGFSDSSEEVIRNKLKKEPYVEATLNGSSQ